MFLHKLNLNPFFAPTDSAAGPIEDSALSREDMVDFLSDDSQDDETIDLTKDKTPPPAKEKDDKTKKDEKDDKETEQEDEEVSLEDELEKELEEETEELDDEKLELVTPVRKKEILAKYPDIFKDFPYLEKAYYRERAYTEILPTIEDAKVAVEKAERLDTYENDIMKGSTEMLLSAVLNTDKEAFAKVVDNYLPTLYKVDETAYYHTIGNVIKHTIISMVRDGKGSNNEDLLAAADTVNQYIFGTKNFTPPGRLAKGEVKDTKEESDIDQREVEFMTRQYETVKDSITTKTDNILKSTIDKNIDPKEEMTDYVKRTASKDTFDALENAIAQDTRFRIVLDKLWERAFNNNFNTESMDKIKSAYLSKAKSLLPAILKKNRHEALKGLGKRVRDEEDTDRKDKKGPLPVGKTRSLSASPQSGKSDRDKAKTIPKGMSTLDYLNSD